MKWLVLENSCLKHVSQKTVPTTSADGTFSSWTASETSDILKLSNTRVIRNQGIGILICFSLLSWHSSLAFYIDLLAISSSVLDWVYQEISLLLVSLSGVWIQGTHEPTLSMFCRRFNVSMWKQAVINHSKRLYKKKGHNKAPGFDWPDLGGEPRRENYIEDSIWTR